MKTYTYSYQNGLCLGASADGPCRGREVRPGTWQTWQASLTPRGLGKCQNAPLNVSDASERPKQVVSRFPRPRKGSNKLFQGIRGLGKAQTSCFKVSEASGRLRTAPAGAGKPAGYPKGPECTYPCRGGRLRTPANFAGYPKGPECTTRVGAYCIRPTKHPARDE